MTLYVNVYLFQGVVDDVKIFTDTKESEEDFTEKTGINHQQMYSGNFDEHNFHGSAIFVLNYKETT